MRNRKRSGTCRWSRIVYGVALAFLLCTLAAGGTRAGAAESILGGGVGSTKPATSLPVKPLPAGSPPAGAAPFVSAIAAGEGHSVALKSDGTVWTWGWNRDGQLGDGTVTDRLTPVKVLKLSGVTAISAGGYHTVALKSDGTVWAWGSNQYGQLGDGTSGTSVYKNIPVRVTGLGGVIAIAAGHEFTMALARDRTVWVWGNNYGGVIGDWNTYPVGYSPIPVHVNGLAVVTAIAAGFEHALALVKDGSVWTWGTNSSGQLGGGTVGSNGRRYVPQQVLTGVVAIAAGGGSYKTRHSIIIKPDGTAWTFGINFNGQLGNGTTVNSNTPVPVTGLNSAVAAAEGSDFTTTLRSDGKVWSWGDNYHGQLGDGTTTDRLTPVQASGLTGVAALVAGGKHALALKYDHTVWGWGYNSNGRLGDGTTTSRSTPVPVKIKNILSN